MTGFAVEDPSEAVGDVREEAARLRSRLDAVDSSLRDRIEELSGELQRVHDILDVLMREMNVSMREVEARRRG